MIRPGEQVDRRNRPDAGRPSPPVPGRSRLPGRRSPDNVLDRPVQFIRGVGPHRAKLLAGLGIETVHDLIHYYPFRYEFQDKPRPIDSLVLDEPATIIGVVQRVRYRPIRKRGIHSALHVDLMDSTGRARIVWFNTPYLRDRVQPGQILRLHGKVGVDGDLAQLVNPSIEWLDEQADPASWNTARMVPVYRACEHLSSSQIARWVREVLDDALKQVEEPLPDGVRCDRGLMPRREALLAMHRPTDLVQVESARKRLAYEELFLMQLAIALQRRWTAYHARAPQLVVTPKIDERIRRRFPFPLTDAQNRAVEQIVVDMQRSRPMTRLLQGDVGSGKTVVALYAALVAVANRRQCAIMAPTSVLADQHFRSIEKYLAGSRVRRCLITGKTPKTHRRQWLKAIAEGRMDLVVGTQALLEEEVRFASLGLVVVDEQHKFGVAQRATIKGAVRRRGAGHACPGGSRTPEIPHYLVMTATPIPRTLSMTVFGDLDVSVIDRLPPGRQPIHTCLVAPEQEQAAWQQVRRRIAEGDQVYIVYPLVEESDSLDLKAATAEVEKVRRELLPGARVGLLHGRMKKNDKQAVMNDFAAHRLDVLVATTVIEVGVDVPNATVMVIQHAERYGLSALHQLRGRVGRGNKSSICLLFADARGETARRRLEVLCETTDGFRIAEEDLRIRGPGELLGTRQHGYPELRVANLVDDVALLMQARDDASKVVQEDPGLNAPAHVRLRAELRRRFRDKVAFIDVG